MEMLIKDKVYYKIFDLSFKKSSHIYSKKNDDPSHLEIVTNNRNSILDYYQANNLVILQQIHGTKIIDTELIQDFTVDLAGDGLVTNSPNLILAIQTADCVPILLTSSSGDLIGAAHCGWQGAKVGIVHNLVRVMQDKGARNLRAVIGPSIQQSSYEVGNEFYNNFLDANQSYAKFFIPAAKHQHYMFDLPAYVKMQLQEAGVEEVIAILEDTYTTKVHEEIGIRYKYPSYRRCVHTKELYNSSILSTIIIKGSVNQNTN